MRTDSFGVLHKIYNILHSSGVVVKKQIDKTALLLYIMRYKGHV